MKLILSIVIFVSSSLADDPEITMTTPQIIERWDYMAEIHHVTTSDGYILELHRIPYGRNGTDRNATRPVVFMQHGLLCSSSNWVTNLPNESAGFLFADAGFDVWLGNVRGNTYSNRHTKYTTIDREFWDFTWDEMAEIDLPAMIDYTLKTSGQDSLYYIGHSQGTLTMFALLSENVKFASKINKFFALAPIGSVKNIGGLMGLLANEFGWLFNDWEVVFGPNDFLPNGPLIKFLSEYFCKTMKTYLFCDNVLFMLTGPESHQFNKSRTDIYTAHAPAGTSSLNMVHWTQMTQTGTVSKFDYGSFWKNYEHYGQFHPPQYDFTKVNVPMYLYWSNFDVLADEKDVTGWLIPNLNNEAIKENNHLPNFNHLDFIWGLRASNEIYNPIIEICLNDWEHK